MHTYQWNNRFVQTGGQTLFSPAQDLESLELTPQNHSAPCVRIDAKPSWKSLPVAASQGIATTEFENYYIEAIPFASFCTVVTVQGMGSVCLDSLP